jgi:hypothetical protein
MGESDAEDLDRAAILARRRILIAQAIAGLERSTLIGPKLMALTVSGLATACPSPCLSIYQPPHATETAETCDQTGTDTGTGETNDVCTDETGSTT